MSKTIIGFVGQIASGKDVCKKYIMEKHGASGHRYSTMLRDILNRLYLPMTRENIQNLSTDLRSRFGEDTMARVIAEDIKNDQHEIVIVEGIRRLADIVSLKDFPNFYLISLEAETQIRYERLVKRNENAGDSEKTYQQFLTDEKKETELQIPEVMAIAKYRIDNNGSFDDLYAQIDKIITDIKK